MSRKVYLIRHAQPEFDVPRCIGITDIPLSEEGKEQASRMAGWIKTLGIQRIYSSPLARCTETAKIIARELGIAEHSIEVREDLHEVNVGRWENLTFQEIREKDPETYAAWENDIGYYVIPEGESFYQGGLRFGRCLRGILNESQEDILVVAHSGVIRAYLCEQEKISANKLFGRPFSYVSVAELEIQDEDAVTVVRAGYRPPAYLDADEIHRLYQKCGTPQHVIRHMQAVAGCLDTLEKRLEAQAGLKEIWCRDPKNWEILKKAALVHDIARLQKHHAEKGADLLRKEGYMDLEMLVRDHHSTAWCERADDCLVTMEEVFFYADKRVLEDQVVSLDERFETSLKKCTTEEAREKHRRLYEKSIHIENRMNVLTGGEIL